MKSQIFAVIKRFSEKYPVSQMCEFYNVSRQGYYEYLKRQQAGNPDQELIDMIAECQKANKNRLGYRRVQKWLKREKGLNINIIMPDGTAYLSAIRDLCGQFIVAYRTARRQDYSLIRNTIADAMQSEKPERPPLLHSDGGGQYRSYKHKNV